jgi:tetratricopeptide (TPR) repeat protein
VGYLAARQAYRDQTTVQRHGASRKVLPLVELVIADSASRLWRLLAPASAAGSIREYELLAAEGAWVENRSGYCLLATALKKLRLDLKTSRGQATIEQVDHPLLPAWIRAVLDGGSSSLLQRGLTESLLYLAQHVPIEQIWDELHQSYAGPQLSWLQVILTRQLKRKFGELFRLRSLARAEHVLSVLRLVGDAGARAWIDEQVGILAAYRALTQTEDKWQKYEAARRLPFLTETERAAVARELWQGERPKLDSLILSGSTEEALDLFWRLRAVPHIPEDLDRLGLRIARALEHRAEDLLPTDPGPAATAFQEALALYAACRAKGPKEWRREAFLLEGLGEAYEKLGRLDRAILCYERMRKDAVEPEEGEDVTERLARLYEMLGLADRAAEVLGRVRPSAKTSAPGAPERWSRFLEEASQDPLLSRLGMEAVIQELRAYEEFHLKYRDRR